MASPCERATRAIGSLPGACRTGRTAAWGILAVCCAVAAGASAGCYSRVVRATGIGNPNEEKVWEPNVEGDSAPGAPEDKQGAGSNEPPGPAP